MTSVATDVDTSDSQEYPSQTFNITTDVGTFAIIAGSGSLEASTAATVSGVSAKENSTGINGALSNITEDKTPLIGFSVRYDVGGNEIAPLTDITYDISFSQHLLNSYDSYALVMKHLNGTYEVVSDHTIVDISNTGVVFMSDIVGTWFLVGIGAKH